MLLLSPRSRPNTMEPAQPNQGSQDSAQPISDSELLHALLETVEESIYFKDAQCRFLRASSYLARRSGNPSAESIIGLTDFDLYTADHAEPAFKDEQQIISTGVPITNKEEQETYDDGHIRWVATSKYPLRNREGKIVGTFGISRDVTDRKFAEQERKEMELQANLGQKLESIGRLASGVAHEINTPAQFITDNISFIKRAMTVIPGIVEAYQKLRDTVASGGDPAPHLAQIAKLEKEGRLGFLMSELPQTVDDALEGLTRVSRIVKSLKEFAHPNKTTKELLSLNRCIETTVAISRHEWKYVADVQLDLDPHLPPMEGYLDELNQVILNMVINSAHAIAERHEKTGVKEKGVIRIATGVDGDFIMLTISDDGNGIPEEVRTRIFEPFFTTKDVGRGTGQGLAICRNIIVKRHEGRITFESMVGQGTSFIIYLPVGRPKAIAESIT